MSDPAHTERSETGDGSHTLYSHRFSQHYHNPGGAIAESRHVFFEAGGLYRELEKPPSGPLRILEVGFGSGLNLLLLLEALRDRRPGEGKGPTAGKDRTVDYYSVEAWPLAPGQARELNHARLLGADPGLLPEIFESLSPGMNTFSLPHGVRLHLFQGRFEQFDPGELSADYLFHDPFSPEVNPELWSGETFRRLRGWSAASSVLSTYCAASAARGAMCWAGWKVARAPGALGKREMTLASPDTARLEGFERVDEERLARRYSMNNPASRKWMSP